MRFIRISWIASRSSFRSHERLAPRAAPPASGTIFLSMLTAVAHALTINFQTSCRLKVDSVTAYGTAFNVALHNPTDRPMRLTALHVTFADALGQHQDRTYRYRVLVQPKQALAFATPTVTGVIVPISRRRAKSTIQRVVHVARNLDVTFELTTPRRRP